MRSAVRAGTSRAVDSEWPDARQVEIALQGGSGASATSVATVLIVKRHSRRAKQSDV